MLYHRQRFPLCIVNAPLRRIKLENRVRIHSDFLEIRQDTEKFVHFYCSGLHPTTSRTHLKSVLFFDDANGDSITEESESVD